MRDKDAISIWNIWMWINERQSSKIPIASFQWALAFSALIGPAGTLSQAHRACRPVLQSNFDLNGFRVHLKPSILARRKWLWFQEHSGFRQNKCGKISTLIIYDYNQISYALPTVTKTPAVKINCYFHCQIVRYGTCLLRLLVTLCWYELIFNRWGQIIISRGVGHVDKVVFHLWSSGSSVLLC